jgi:hypothetical protein
MTASIMPMRQLLRFPSAVEREPSIEVWMREHSGELGVIARRWFEVMRTCGDDVRELLHDGHPTACVEDAAGTGRFMRHVKLGPGRRIADAALRALVCTAYADMKRRVEAE